MLKELKEGLLVHEAALERAHAAEMRVKELELEGGCNVCGTVEALEAELEDVEKKWRRALLERDMVEAEAKKTMLGMVETMREMLLDVCERAKGARRMVNTNPNQTLCDLLKLEEEVLAASENIYQGLTELAAKKGNEHENENQ